jgi:hypothetical protein
MLACIHSAMDTCEHEVWRVQMRCFLVHNKLWHTVRHTDARPWAADAEHACALILLHVEEMHFATIQHLESAAEVWDVLERTCRGGRYARKLRLRRELHHSVMSGGESVQVYVARVRRICADLIAVGVSVTDDEIVPALLAGLPAHFGMVVTVIESSEEELTLEAVVTKLLNTEARVAREETAEAHAAAPPQYQPRKETRTCHYCGKPGHLIRDCHARVRAEHAGSQAKALMAGLGAISCCSSTAWLVDSGASHHVCSDRAMFDDLSESRVQSVITANHGVAWVIGQGTLRLRMTVRGLGKVVAIPDVLCVPDFVTNLLSVGKLNDQGMAVTFVRNTCVVGLHGAPIASAKRRDGLFCLNAVPARDGKDSDEGCGSVFATTAACPERAMLWHRRFGHLGFANLGVLQRHGLVRGIDVPQDVFAKLESLDCATCQQTRPRQPRVSSDSESTHVLQLVHSYVFGPMQVPSLGGARYVVTVLDDFSKLSVVKCIAAKNDVLTVLPAMLQLLETQSGRRVQKVRSDRGGEYGNKVLAEFAARKGIVMEVTAGYSPESNGAAERLNRTLLERVRAMLIDASLPLSLWGEAVVAACHVRNRSPISGTRAGTPWGLFFGAVPDVSHLRVFGCKVCCHVPRVLRAKLDSVSYSGVFVGYDGGGHRILVNGTNKVKVSRDCVFLEEPASRAELRSSEPAPKRKSAELVIHVEKKTDAQADVVPVDSSSSEDRVAVGLVPSTLQEQAQSPCPHAGEPAEDEPVAVEETSAEEVEIHRNAPEEQAASPQEPDGPHHPTRNRRPPNRYTFDEDGAAVTMCLEAPASHVQALASPAARQWRQAMDEEMASLHSNGTWDLQPLPAGRKAVACRWVFALKRDSKGAVERYKARLVAKGFSQKPGVDYGEVWAPVSQYKTLRILLAAVAAEDLHLHQLDIKTAFLNGVVDEELYMQQPPGYAKQGDERVCRLRRALYGLKQASRTWHLALKDFLCSLGFEAADADPCFKT